MKGDNGGVYRVEAAKRRVQEVRMQKEEEGEEEEEEREEEEEEEEGPREYWPKARVQEGWWLCQTARWTSCKCCSSRT